MRRLTVLNIHQVANVSVWHLCCSSMRTEVCLLKRSYLNLGAALGMAVVLSLPAIGQIP
jgi:hypothetical protein